MPQIIREQLYPLGFQCGRKAWQKLTLAEALKSFDPAKLFLLRQQTAAELRRTTAAPLTAAELQLWGVLNHALHLLGRRYLTQQQLVIPSNLQDTVRALFREQLQNFPIVPSRAVETSVALNTGEPACLEFLLIELCLLSLQSQNQALRDGRSLFNPELQQLRTDHHLDQLLQQVDQQVASDSSAFAGRSLLALLQEPLITAPDSLAGQVISLRQKWGELLPPELLSHFDTALQLQRDEFRSRGPVGEGEPPAPRFTDAGEVANFTLDRDWMPRTVLLAKAIFVWLSQLSTSYDRDISRLDQIPDEELDRLRDFGFSGLWLIGIWQRSDASKKIKHLHGKYNVSASAYAIFDYRIADELGGDPGLENLRQRCLQRGIRLACDVVTNHTGIDSQWMRQHPDWFIQSDQPPYPGYRYNGADLSGEGRLCLQIEDGYYDHSEAAVVFCRRDLQSGEVRYIYHGNDGTHLPWNDTAQLNFLLPQVREAMIQVILEAAKRFGIIRFDAAMTLAKKHFQRLWYPLPDGGEGVPSRSAYALSNDEFNRYFPQEFWREVVERIKTEQPDTLLVAEAFWLMEGYFVRTLGMHRVYNSAFMNMLMREDNARYRQTLRETLAFDPAILQRFVNFMSNPDEKTAIEQFGNGDKYFCVATLLCTMPGLPLFAHGQLEGLREKYGMEYTRPELQESPDQRLLHDHWQLLSPLLRKRPLFSGSENFQLYDFVSELGLEEHVYAFSNAAGKERVLVLCNNSPHRISGRITATCPTKYGERSLNEALALNQTQGFYSCASPTGPLEYLWPLGQEDKPFELPPYGRIVLDQFTYRADEDGRWRNLYQQIGNNPTLDLAARAHLVGLWPVLDQLSSWLDGRLDLAAEPETSFARWANDLVIQLATQKLSAIELLDVTAAVCLEPRLKLSTEDLTRISQLMSKSDYPTSVIKLLFDDVALKNFLGIHQSDNKVWFRREPLQKLIFLIMLQKLNSHNINVNNIDYFLAKIKISLINFKQILILAESSGYLLDNFLQSLSATPLSPQQQLPQAVTGRGPLAMKILFVSSEATPFAKTGGLADVVGSLPRALRQLGHDVRVIMPCYRSVQRNGFSLSKGRKALEVKIGGEIVRANLRQTIWEGVPYHFIDTPEYFDRESLYGTPEGDFQDNASRFAFFNRAVLEYLLRADFRPDILHLHDWQTALIPALLKTEHATDPFYASTATVLTLHNLGYQGIFPLDVVEKLRLPPEFATTRHLEYFGNISFLKGGIVHADLINTVSPTYCREIQQPEQGHGFDGLLRSRSRDLFGILNGINRKNWDPALDPALNKPFNSTNLNGKRSCKRALQKELGLAERHDLPLIAVVSRLDKQKGIDLIEQIWPQLMQREMQFVLLGSGDQEQMAFWQARQREKSANFAIGLEFDEKLSHRIFSAADCLLIPSRYEPCGLTQMIALRYGALPIVRHTGGLADTVTDLKLNGKTGNGFVFDEVSPEELLDTIDRALALYPQRNRWISLVKKGMEIDFSWTASAHAYEDLYRRALIKRTTLF
ncbi:glycogen synthase GlgA [Geopsychrobacter electrodiphilus]|uniref:glycogen synthase GlgA n=1 Tax=Geopsychrobacter electrodiphilus TaxID=225196 RepID=UPI00036C1D28|nr:glycogen synthase GlgA [Geopsychrobacter electrodiphilus]